MLTCNRRQFLASAVGTLLSTRSSEGAGALFPLKALDEVKLFGKSGDDNLDRALIAELKRIIHVLEVNPGFKYSNEMNAWATRAIIVQGTEGSVILGLPLIKRLIKQADGGVAVAGTCAHECGHIYQYYKAEKGLSDRLTKNVTNVKLVELHADFLAGYYIGKRTEFSPTNIATVSAATYKIGDYQYADVNTHGTPGQRSAAVEKGYRVALEGSPLAKAAEIGVGYVANL